MSCSLPRTSWRSGSSLSRRSESMPWTCPPARAVSTGDRRSKVRGLGLVDLPGGAIALPRSLEDVFEVFVGQQVRGSQRGGTPVQLGQPFEKLEAFNGLIHGGAVGD